MRAVILLRTRLTLSETSFVDIRIWQVPLPVRASAHRFKYSLALVSDALCVLRYDNEAGKGDHKHNGTEQIAYAFESLEKLQDDFWKDVDRWMTQQTRP